MNEYFCFRAKILAQHCMGVCTYVKIKKYFVGRATKPARPLSDEHCSPIMILQLFPLPPGRHCISDIFLVCRNIGIQWKLSLIHFPPVLLLANPAPPKLIQTTLSPDLLLLFQLFASFVLKNYYIIFSIILFQIILSR